MINTMSEDVWRDGSGASAMYESRGLYSSADALDNAPLLGDEAYTEIPVCAGGGGGGAAERAPHCHWRALAEPPSAVPQLLAAVALCGFFMVCELIGGYLAGSLAIMCDAAHLLSDCGGFGLALLAFHLAERPTDTRMSYGYRRAEVLGAMASVLLIWVLTGVFVYMASVRLYSGDYDIEPDTMMAVSGAGVLINILMALVLHGCCSGIAHHHAHGGAACTQHRQTHPHAHGGGDEHAHAHAHDASEHIQFYRNGREARARNGSVPNGDFTLKDVAAGGEGDACAAAAPAVRPGKNINLRAAFIHVLGDLIQSCGVFLASLVIKFYPTWKVVDPICTFVFSVVVLATTARVVRDALAVLMQAVPAHFPYRECLASLQAVGGVRAVHSLHVWGLSTHNVVLTAHIVIDDFVEWESVLQTCISVARRHGADSATLQVERYRPAMASCDSCSSQPGARA